MNDNGQPVMLFEFAGVDARPCIRFAQSSRELEIASGVPPLLQISQDYRDGACPGHTPDVTSESEI